MNGMPNVGDEVEVTVKGVVEVVAPWTFDVCPTGARGFTVRIPYEPQEPVEGLNVTVLAAPEPDWQSGDVVLDGEGCAAEHVGGFGDFGGGWWRRFSGAEISDSLLPRPLTLLVRNGEAVTP